MSQTEHVSSAQRLAHYLQKRWVCSTTQVEPHVQAVGYDIGCGEVVYCFGNRPGFLRCKACMDWPSVEKSHLCERPSAVCRPRQH